MDILCADIIKLINGVLILTHTISLKRRLQGSKTTIHFLTSAKTIKTQTKTKISISNNRARLHGAIIAKTTYKALCNHVNTDRYYSHAKKVKQRKTHPIFPHLAPYKMHNHPETGPTGLTHFARGQGFEYYPVECLA